MPRTPDNPPAPRFSEQTGWLFRFRHGGSVTDFNGVKPDERIKSWIFRNPCPRTLPNNLFAFRIGVHVLMT